MPGRTDPAGRGQGLSAGAGGDVQHAITGADLGGVEHLLGGGTQPRLDRRSPTVPGLGGVLPLDAGGRLEGVGVKGGGHRISSVVGSFDPSRRALGPWSPRVLDPDQAGTDFVLDAGAGAGDHGGVRDYNQYCPVALASEVLADRWTLLITRELVLGGRRFNDIARALPGISRSVLQQRLLHLERRGVLDRVPIPGGHEYELTPAGRDLEPVIMAMGEWAVRWMFAEPEPREVDPVTLTWLAVPPNRS